ncbi:MAG: hypothetical protein EAY81_09915 [Bacteroidetes bacterium]|nr:MAG: hypothetical protein EAY81_09915 [Bacteroidota bacterium]
MNQKHANNKKYGQLLYGLKITVAITFLGLASCSEDGKCLEETVDIGVIPVGETPLLDSMAKAEKMTFLFNDTATIELIRYPSSITRGNRTTFQDEQCNVSYTPEVKTTGFKGTSKTLSEIRFRATIDFKTKRRDFYIELGNMPYQGSSYTIYEYAYLNLDNPVFPLKMDLLNVNGKDFANVKIITGSSGSYLFFSAQNELIEIRMSNGNVLSKIN